MFNENIYEPAEFAVCYEPRAIRGLRHKIINLRYVNNSMQAFGFFKNMYNYSLVKWITGKMIESKTL